jgi:hypothetical protein
MAGRRVEMGFEGGTILRLTVEEAAAQELVGSLANGSGWRSVEADEGTHWLNLAELVYIRLVPGEPARVGFGGSEGR